MTKFDVLCRMAAEFNRGRLVWALGGSLMLYFKGIVTDFHDIDLMIAPEDGAEAAKMMEALGAEAKPVKPSARFQSDHIWKFCLDGVDVDMIAGFGIVFEGQKFAFPFGKDDIAEIIDFNGEKIPLQGVAAWREYYRLMERPEKTALIDRWMQAGR